MNNVNKKTVKTCQYCNRQLDKDYDICPYCSNELKPHFKNSNIDNYENVHKDDDNFVYNEIAEVDSKEKNAGLICIICGGIVAVTLIICLVITSHNTRKTREFETMSAEKSTTTTVTTQVTVTTPTVTAPADPVVVSITKPSKVKIAKVKSGKKRLKITWKKIAGVTKYRVKVSTNKKGNKNVSYENVPSNKNSVIVNGLKKKTYYYVRVKAVKINYGVKVEGNYSKYVKKRTK